MSPIPLLPRHLWRTTGITTIFIALLFWKITLMIICAIATLLTLTLIYYWATDKQNQKRIQEAIENEIDNEDSHYF